MLELRCPRCKAPQTLAEAPSAGDAVRVACLTCGAVFRVRGRAKTPSELLDVRAPPPLPDDDDASAAGERGRESSPRWQVRKADGTALQFPNLRVFQRWVVDGVVSLDDAISHNGRTWRPITTIPELVALFERVEQMKGAGGGGSTPSTYDEPQIRAEVTSSDPPELPPAELPVQDRPPAELPPEEPLLSKEAPVPESDISRPVELERADADELPDSGIDSTLLDISLADIRAGLAMDFGDFKAAAVGLAAPTSAPEPEPIQPSVADKPGGTAAAEALGPSMNELSDYLAGAHDDPPAVVTPPLAAGEPSSEPVRGPWTAGDDATPAGSASDIEKLRETMPDESELIGSTLQMRLPDMRVARTATPVPYLPPDVVMVPVAPPAKRLWLLIVTVLALGGAGIATWWFVARESPSHAEPVTQVAAKNSGNPPAPTAASAAHDGGVAGPDAAKVAKTAKPAPVPTTRTEGQPNEAETRRGAMAAIDMARPVVVKAEPKAAEPQAVEPKAVEPKVAEPKAVEPKVAEPRAVEPKAVEPKAVEPKVTEAEGVDPYDAAISEASAAQKSGNLSGALAALERAASLNPKTVEPIAKMGWIHLNMGNASQAIVRFQEAKRRNPGYRDTYLGLAKAYEADGRRDEAIDVYRNYLRLCATSKCRQADAVKATLTRLGAVP